MFFRHSVLFREYSLRRYENEEHKHLTWPGGNAKSQMTVGCKRALRPAHRMSYQVLSVPSRQNWVDIEAPFDFTPLKLNFQSVVRSLFVHWCHQMWRSNSPFHKWSHLDCWSGPRSTADTHFCKTGISKHYKLMLICVPFSFQICKRILTRKSIICR